MDDVVTADVLATEKVSVFEVLNVCSGNDRSIWAGAKLSRIYDSTAKRLFMAGISPAIGLEEGLKLMYEDIVSETSSA